MGLDNASKNHSGAWYLAPIFLGILGGIVMYLIIKDDDSRMAKKGLIVGLIITAAGITAAGITAVGVIASIPFD